LKNKKGFTFIEILIYLGITSLLTLSLVVFAGSAISSGSKVYVAQEVQANARAAFSLVSGKIRSASAVSSPTKGNSTGTLILNMPDPSPDIIFSVTDGVLIIKDGAADPVAITSRVVSVSNLSFSNIALLEEKDNIRIEMTVEYKEAGSREYQYSFALQGAVNLRE